MSHPKFWGSQEDSAKVVKQLKSLKLTVEPWESVFKKYQEIKELAEILKDEDKELVADVSRNINILLDEVDKLEFKTLLGGEFDRNSAILSINAGAGGTESCDWVQMLLRMYSRYAENHGYKVKTIDLLYGEEAGIKNVTILVEGEYAYGYLKAERGVHRLVRISPFDANKRRHTSFAAVFVYPEVDDSFEIEIDTKDLRIDTYRATGKGGQHVNTTDSAVRITHIPTNTVAQCQNERSQHQNKDTALKILRSKLYEMELRKKMKEKDKLENEKGEIAWGNQIRSYVLQPYQSIKDHRTNFEIGNTQRVLDGDIFDFIKASLKKRAA